ncbi:T9SS type A sorting domain-containing protein [Bacteroidota bacterium]
MNTRLLKNAIALNAMLCLFSNQSISSQVNHLVEVSNNVYAPRSLTIDAGDTVTWKNIQGNHNVNGSQSVFPDNPESFGNSTGFNWTYSYVFTKPGTYEYQCDPHVNFNMFGEVVVNSSNEPNLLRILFLEMQPHIGQDLYVRITNTDQNSVVLQLNRVIEDSFSIEVDDVIADANYAIEFFADDNGNGYYDGLPTDHSWMIELKTTMGINEVTFTHSGDFTELDWERQVILNLNQMLAHVGQNMFVALINSDTGEIEDRRGMLGTESLSLSFGGIIPGRSYHLDFYADFDGSGYYNSPPTDHAWRVNIPAGSGDTTIDFNHNSNFTDIEWKHMLKVNFMEMSPNFGQPFRVYLREASSDAILDSLLLDTINGSEFDVRFYGIEVGRSYHLDFYADMNMNGSYDSPPVDHAWRLLIDNVAGDVEEEFTYNTSFTDIFLTGATSMEESLEASSFKIYPNPASDKIYIQSDYNGSVVSMYNMTGEEVFRIVDADLSQPISVENLPSGIYIVKLESNYGNQDIAKLVIE